MSISFSFNPLCGGGSNGEEKLVSIKIYTVPRAWERVSERASERESAAERASEASSAEQANE